uniref:Envelope membrane protein n=1 Tax=Hyalogonium fusiforme TaxID=2926373 RepID=A0A9E8ADV1_9CHLO|nr:envelope membrane protein [Hyalogonium fusiforme]
MQVFSNVDQLVIQEYRFYKSLFLTSLSSITLLFFAPLLVSSLAKTYVVSPITSYLWDNQKQPAIFLNQDLQKKAFFELKNYDEKLYFENLVYPIDLRLSAATEVLWDPCIKYSKGLCPKRTQTIGSNKNLNNESSLRVALQYQAKTISLAMDYNIKSISALINLTSDVISLVTVFYLLQVLEVRINITKAFLSEIFYSLSDSTKSLLILLVTDLMVGYHSSNCYHLLFQNLFNRYGLSGSESPVVIALLVSTLPVFLDVLFKYLIFRHLNRSSPATVATYHSMIE